jgi:hypothetical protein
MLLLQAGSKPTKSLLQWGTPAEETTTTPTAGAGASSSAAVSPGLASSSAAVSPGLLSDVFARVGGPDKVEVSGLQVQSVQTVF